MDSYQHDNTLQTNLSLKQRELEDLLVNKDVMITNNSPLPANNPPIPCNNFPVIRFQQYHYKVFKDYYVQSRPSAPHKRSHQHQASRKEIYSPVVLPETPTDVVVVNLRNILPMDIVRKPRKMTTYDKLMRKLNVVLCYLRDLAKERERLLFTAKHFEDPNAVFIPKLDSVGESRRFCCDKVEPENFQLLINKASEVIQSATIESNLYRGMILMISNNCDLFDSYSSMTSRLILKELDECIDDVMTTLNELIGIHNCLISFDAFVKRDELLAAVDSLITCIRCCASYTWAMQSRIDQKSPCGSGSSSTDQQRRRIKTTVRSVEAVLRTPEKYINIGSI